MGCACRMEPPGVLQTEPGGPVSLAARDDKAPARHRRCAVSSSFVQFNSSSIVQLACRYFVQTSMVRCAEMLVSAVAVTVSPGRIGSTLCSHAAYHLYNQEPRKCSTKLMAGRVRARGKA
eukprot:GHUV01031021.1.p2 GENE.GHUV01031021.1~~GHUV01031021.1.p2  ORF type:complete len:120 (+),score=18.20 GHUV01031021.1:654-1013(+)